MSDELKYGLIFVAALVGGLMLFSVLHLNSQRELVTTQQIPLVIPQQGAPATVASTGLVSTHLVDVGNKVCPVSGRPIGTMGPGIEQEYNGKIYHLCCGGCIGRFLSDPERYSKIAEDQARVL